MAEERVSSSSSGESFVGWMNVCVKSLYVGESSDKELILVLSPRNAVNSDVSSMPYCISVVNRQTIIA